MFFNTEIFELLTLFLTISYSFFLSGVWGILFNYSNLLKTMLCIELMYFGIVCCFSLISILLCDINGHLYSMIILILAAAESAVGLGILIVLFRYGQSIDFKVYQELRG